MDLVASIYYYFKLGAAFDHQNKVNLLVYDDLLARKKIDGSSGIERLQLRSVAIASLPPPSTQLPLFSASTVQSAGSYAEKTTSMPSSLSPVSSQVFTVAGGVRICIVSDTHERHRLLPDLCPCDLFIHVGDILMTSRMLSASAAARKLADFNEWLGKIPAAMKIVVAGNHDVALENLGIDASQKLLSNCVYLCNSVAEYKGVRIFGTPLSTGRSQNRAFQSRDFRDQTIEALDGMRSRGQGIDIMVTHGPLSVKAFDGLGVKVHLWGHVHEYYGASLIAAASETPTSSSRNDVDGGGSGGGGGIGGIGGNRFNTLSICACNMGAQYDMAHLPVVLDFSTSASTKPND